MDATIDLVAPDQISRNPENPRLIFRQDDMQALEDSIRSQGILVPLTVYSDGAHYVLLDGERRWRCARKLSLTRVPVIVQPKPDRLQNIMMMFAIHNARRDWDPLPTAYKLLDLERAFITRNKRRPTEIELSELASMSRGEIRRLRRLLSLPESYQGEVMEELRKPRTEQTLTVDHVLEATKGAAALASRGIISPSEEQQLSRAIIDKFRSHVIKNTVAPRQLARIARAVERNEVTLQQAHEVATRLIEDKRYSISAAFDALAARADFEHGVEQAAERLDVMLQDHLGRRYAVGPALRKQLEALRLTLTAVLGSGNGKEQI